MTADGRHSTQTANHRIENFVFADATARAAGTGYTITVLDVGKIAYQSDTGSYSRLVSVGPLTWAFISSSSGGAPDSGTYLTRNTVSGLASAFSLGSLYTGLLMNGVSASLSTPRVAAQGTDYYAPGGVDVQIADGGTGASSASAARTALGLAIGTDIASQISVTTITGNNQTGTTYTLVLADAGKVVEGNNGSAITFTIPPTSSVNWPIGTVIEVFQQGAGQITVAPGSGVTLRSDGAKLKTAGQYATIGLRMRASDEWVLSGDLSA